MRPRGAPSSRGHALSLGTILVILLILVLLGVVPLGAGYNACWGYGPGGIVGLILIVVIVLAVMGRI